MYTCTYMCYNDCWFHWYRPYLSSCHIFCCYNNCNTFNHLHRCISGVREKVRYDAVICYLHTSTYTSSHVCMYYIFEHVLDTRMDSSFQDVWVSLRYFFACEPLSVLKTFFRCWYIVVLKAHCWMWPLTTMTQEIWRLVFHNCLLRCLL